MLRAIAPGKWADDGPQSAGGFAFAGALQIGDMIVPPSGPKPITSAESERRNRRRIKRGYQPRAPLAPRCGTVMAKSGAACGRRMGHNSSHLSAAYVAKDNARLRDR